ncbi:MAG: helix-turn-helix domain-containing protein [Nitrospiraceae bacterium]|nr:helix-turn-helix domain-containing protein [Nitrospiraceae bacterium]
MCEDVREWLQKPVLTGWKMVAEYLNVHEQTAMKWGKKHGLPFAKIDGQILTTKNAVQVWILENIKNNDIEPGQDESE